MSTGHPVALIGKKVRAMKRFWGVKRGEHRIGVVGIYRHGLTAHPVSRLKNASLWF